MKIMSLIIVLLLSLQIISSQAQESITLQLYAAASLTDSFNELASAFTEQHAHNIRFNFAGSSTLAAQIQQGAPADIFASANIAQMQNLADDALIEADNIVTFAYNDLVLIVPHNNPANIETVLDVANPDVLLILATPTVPIREYTNVLLDNLDTLYQTPISDAILQNTVSEETNVRQIVAKITLGEADAAFVYRSDVTPDIADAVQTKELPSGASPLAEYVIAPVVDTRNGDVAQQFIEFIVSPDGQRILEGWGFCRVNTNLGVEITPEVEATPEATPHDEVTCA